MIYLNIAFLLLSISSIYCCNLNSSFSFVSKPLLNLIGNELENIASNQNKIIHLDAAILQTNESLTKRIVLLETDLANLLGFLKYFGLSG